MRWMSLLAVRGSRLVVSTIVLGELRAGIAAGQRASDNVKRLERFLSLPGVEILGIDERTSEFYGNLHAQLRASGHPLPTNDIWIAASALQHGLWLFSYDRHLAITLIAALIADPLSNGSLLAKESLTWCRFAVITN